MEKPTEYSLTWEVTDEMTAKRIGSAGSKILSTPNMVALMEAAALELAKAYLDEGMTTVGAEIHCRHLAPTPVGMKVWAEAEVTAVEGRKRTYALTDTGLERYQEEIARLRSCLADAAQAEQEELPCGILSTS